MWAMNRFRRAWQVSEPELPERFTKPATVILREIREVWQSVKLPTVIDWERDVRGVRWWWCEHSKHCVPEDGQYLCGEEEVAGKMISVDKYVANRDEKRRYADNFYKGMRVTNRIFSLLRFDWYEILRDEVKLAIADTHMRTHCSIVFANDRFYLPRSIAFAVSGSMSYKLKVIRDDDAIRYVTAGRNPADFHPDSSFLEAAGLVGDIATRQRSVGATMLARQDDLF